MASITKEKNGRKIIQFVGADGRRRTIRLGKATMNQANGFKGMIERVVAAQVSGQPLEQSVASWLGSLDETMRNRLAAVGLVSAPVAMTLGEFVSDYIQRRGITKANTLRNYERTKAHLVEYFGKSKRLRDVTAGDADEFKQHLLKSLAPTTVGREVKRARQFFRAAVRKELIEKNPFEDVTADAQVNTSREFFVAPATVEKVLSSCPDVEWRTIVALVRYGGLRCPSEVLRLKWGDVDWELDRLTVHATKTEHHQHGGVRKVPLFPELRRVLSEAFELAEPGAEFVIARYRDTNSNLRTQLLRILKRAGVEPWPKLFQNLRASRQTELTATWPTHVVCAWLGNSPATANKHYLQVTEADFQQAASAAISDASVVQRAANSDAVKDGKSQNQDAQEVEKARQNQALFSAYPLDGGLFQIELAPPRGVEPLFSG